MLYNSLKTAVLYDNNPVPGSLIIKIRKQDFANAGSHSSKSCVKRS